MTSQSILELRAKETLSDYVTAIAWSPIGNLLVAASGAGEVQVLNHGVGILLVQPGAYSMDALAFSADGKWLAAGGQNGTITLWQVESGTFKLADTLDCGGWIDRLNWHPICNYSEFILPGYSLFGLPDDNNVDLYAPDCAQISSFSPKQSSDRASRISRGSPMVGHLVRDKGNS